MSPASHVLVSRLDDEAAAELERRPLGGSWPEGATRAYVLRAAEGAPLLLLFCSDPATAALSWPGSAYEISREIRVADWRGAEAAARDGNL